jgi:hypothetical protein
MQAVKYWQAKCWMLSLIKSICLLLFLLSCECIENEDLIISDNIVNRHDFNYIYNPEYEICGQDLGKNATLLVYGM